MKLTIASMDARGSVSGTVLEASKSASRVVVQTDMCAALKQQGIAYETLDDLYESTDDFDELAETACGRSFRIKRSSLRWAKHI